MALRELHLFAGAGGGILGGLLLGHVPVCAVELEEYPRNVLLQRQRDGILPWFPIWDDVCTFSGHEWRGRVDVICGGFPCQDISSAGKGAGIDGARSGLWGEFARIIGEVRPRFVFVENSPMLVGRGLGRVLGDLATLGFDAEWCVLGSADAGMPAKRDRIWIMAFPSVWECPTGENVKESRFERLSKKWASDSCERVPIADGLVAIQIPSSASVDHGLANWMDEVRAIGNGQVPAVAALAWETLMGRIQERDQQADHTSLFRN